MKFSCLKIKSLFYDGLKDIIEKLKTIAPVRAVRGNMDRGQWVHDIPVSEAFEISGKSASLVGPK